MNNAKKYRKTTKWETLEISSRDTKETFHAKKKVKSLSRVRLFATPWTVAYQAPPSMEFSRQEYWSGLPFPSPGDLPDPGIKPWSPALEADTLPFEPPGKPFHAKMGTIRTEMARTYQKQKRFRRGDKNTQKNYKNDPDNHNGVVTHLQPDMLECEVKWNLGSTTTKPVEVMEFQLSFFKF